MHSFSKVTFIFRKQSKKSKALANASVFSLQISIFHIFDCFGLHFICYVWKNDISRFATNDIDISRASNTKVRTRMTRRIRSNRNRCVISTRRVYAACVPLLPPEFNSQPS